MLHSYGTASKLSREGKCRQVGCMSKSVPEVRFNPNVTSELVLISVPALAEAFFAGVDKFLVHVFADRTKALMTEQRLKNLVQAIPLKKEHTNAV